MGWIIVSSKKWLKPKNTNLAKAIITSIKYNRQLKLPATHLQYIPGFYTIAMASISTRAFFANFEISTVARAGGFPVKYVA